MRRIKFHRKNLSKILLGIIIFQVSFAATCGNNDTKTKTVARAEDDFAQSYKSTATVLTEAKQINAISQDDINFLKPILTEIGNAHLQIIELTREFIALGANPSIEKQQRLLEAINFISDRLVTLNNEGILRIKNETKRLLFNTAVLTMQSAVTSFVITLNLRKI